MGSLRSPGEAGVQESPHRPGSGYAGPSLQMPPVHCPGKGVEAGPGVFMVFKQVPEARLEGRLSPGWPLPQGAQLVAAPRTGPGPAACSGALPPEEAVLGPLGALPWQWLSSPCWGEGLTQCQPRGRFRKEADRRTPGYHSRVGLCYVPATC